MGGLWGEEVGGCERGEEEGDEGGGGGVHGGDNMGTMSIRATGLDFVGIEGWKGDGRFSRG